MPRNTPIYGFTYQCPGDIVDAADFALLGGQIDAKMTALDALQVRMLTRRNTNVDQSAVGVASGVEASLAPAYVFPVAGIYQVRGIVNNPGFATINMQRVRLRHNVTDYLGQTANTEGNQGALVPWGATCFVAAAGDTGQLRYLFNGSGPVNINGTFSVRLIAEIR
jgi:hypothetical protein